MRAGSIDLAEVHAFFARKLAHGGAGIGERKGLLVGFCDAGEEEMSGAEALDLPAGAVGGVSNGLQCVGEHFRRDRITHVAVAEARGERSLAELARSLQTSWPSAQRLENPRHSPTLRQLEKAAAALGKRLVLALE